MLRSCILLAPLAALAASGIVRADTVQCPATLALVLSSTGAQSNATGRSGTTLTSAPLEKIRLGNREVLENLLADAVLPGDSIRGWKLVALWANWADEDPYAGNGYRFFARRGKGATTQLIAVPASYLSILPLQASVGYRNVFDGETIIGGTETYSVLAQVGFHLDGCSGAPLGLQTGTGRFVRPARSDNTYYLPSANKITLAGAFENPDEGKAGVVGGSLGFGAAKLVRALPNDGGSTTGSMSFDSFSITTAVGPIDGSEFFSAIGDTVTGASASDGTITVP